MQMACPQTVCHDIMRISRVEASHERRGVQRNRADGVLTWGHGIRREFNADAICHDQDYVLRSCLQKSQMTGGETLTLQEWRSTQSISSWRIMASRGGFGAVKVSCDAVCYRVIISFANDTVKPPSTNLRFPVSLH